MFLVPKYFWESPLKILDRHYKIRLSSGRRAKFRADRRRISEISRLK